MANKFVCVDIHTVRPKDTLYSIAKKYGMNVDLLMRVNGIRNPYNLRVGTRICIPGMLIPDGIDDLPNIPGIPGIPGLPGTPGRPNRPNRPTQPEQPGEEDDSECRKMYTVRQGDTLYMIAKRHKVTLDELMNANPDIDPYKLRKGMDICIPR